MIYVFSVLQQKKNKQKKKTDMIHTPLGSCEPRRPNIMFSVDRDKLFICVPTYRLIILVSRVLINKPMRSE